MTNIPCDFFLTFTPEFERRYDMSVDPRVRSLTAKLTKTKPRPNERRGGVCVKVRALLPEQAFAPLAPECVIEIPLENTELVQVTILPPDEAKAA